MSFTSSAFFQSVSCLYKRFFIGILFISSLVSSAANAEYDLWPDVEYNPNIPTHMQVLGYEVGERITNHGDMLRFFEALERAAPDRIRLFEYGRTWEGRKLIYAAIGQPELIKDLEGFSSDMQSLSDPRVTDKNQAKQFQDALPSSVWLQYGVHGNEISTTDAAMMTAYHLLAAPDEPTNKKILNNNIVFIDPLQNPDGRTRFTQRYYASVGISHSPDRLSAEHNEPWPRGRTNHYLFDMNRDWLALTQPETQGKVKILNKYRPLVVIDLHEMGGDSSYFFAPSAQPFNPHIHPNQIENITLVGRNNGKHFDKFGFDYFTREVYDAFFPGYGDSWPTFYGAAASTYEVGSSRGEVFLKDNGELLTFKDTVHKHFVASISTAEAVADNREKLLKDYYQYQVDAIKSGKADKKERTFILSNGQDRTTTHKLATLMAQHGVEVQQATESFKACGETYQAGTYFIDTAQPRGRFVKTTFTQQVDMSDAFIKEQERRRARLLRDEIYDVTAWSLPLMFNVDTDTCGKAVSAKAIQLEASDKLVGSVANPDANVAYLVPWGDMASVHFLTQALQQGLIVKSADKAFQLDSKQSFPAGSLIIEKRRNSADLAAKVQQIAADTGALVTGVDSSWVINGPSFGSGDVVDMPALNIAMAWDEPVSSLSAGNSRFVIEQELNYPVTAIRTDKLGSGNLAHYQVLILPSGRYGQAFSKSALDNIKNWVDNGGVLITFGDATAFAASSKAGLLDVKRELAVTDKEDSANSKSDSDRVKGQLLTDKQALLDASVDAKQQPDYVAGVLANIEVDQEHWLTAGVNPNVVAMVSGRNIYTPITLTSGKNLAWFKDEESLLASGYLWKENTKQLAYKPFLIIQPQGNGMVIGYTQEPTTRAYLDGLNVMLANTIFRAAAHAQPLR
ncbi:M14 family zinc carboxypeptidase [Paraglaciecola sp. 2405UD69-4]|uniref:M14 family zinc carboxypeptidase n=1 Tax=Paraglaciecola sp. 2405UD69-4 TaxID=3391836 RepID=UPI0039C912BD